MKLDSRETTIMEMISLGASNMEVAAKLNCSCSYLERRLLPVIYNKLGVSHVRSNTGRRVFAACQAVRGNLVL